MEGEHHHGYIAKLPVGPMAKKHGAKYAAFDPNGQKLGYVNGLQDAIDKGIFKPLGEGTPQMGNPPPGAAIPKPPVPGTPEPELHAPAAHTPQIHAPAAANPQLHSAETLMSLSPESINKLLEHEDVANAVPGSFMHDQKKELLKAKAAKGMIESMSHNELAQHFGHLVATNGEAHPATQAAAVAMKHEGMLDPSYVSPQPPAPPPGVPGLHDAIGAGMFPHHPTPGMGEGENYTPWDFLGMWMENQIEAQGGGDPPPFVDWPSAIDDMKNYLAEEGQNWEAEGDLHPQYEAMLNSVTDKELMQQMKQSADAAGVALFDHPQPEPHFQPNGMLPPLGPPTMTHAPGSWAAIAGHGEFTAEELGHMPTQQLLAMAKANDTHPVDRTAIIHELSVRGVATPSNLKDIPENQLWNAHDALPHGSKAAQDVATAIIHKVPKQAQKESAQTLFPQYPWSEIVHPDVAWGDYLGGTPGTTHPMGIIPGATGPHEALIGEPTHEDLVHQEVGDFLETWHHGAGGLAGLAQPMDFNTLANDAMHYVQDSIPDANIGEVEKALLDYAKGTDIPIPLPHGGEVGGPGWVPGTHIPGNWETDTMAAEAGHALGTDHALALSQMPKYAQKSEVLKSNGTHVGYLAKLPGPMKKNTGKLYAHFDTNGVKKGYVNSHTEIKDMFGDPLPNITKEPLPNTAALAAAGFGPGATDVGSGHGQTALAPQKVTGPVQLHEVGSIATGAPKNSEPVSNAQQIFGTHDFSHSNNARLKAVTAKRVKDWLQGTIWKNISQSKLDDQWKALTKRRGKNAFLPEGFRKTSAGWEYVTNEMQADHGYARSDPGEGYKEAMQSYMAGHIIHTWASTSNDQNPLSLAVQDLAQEIFGVHDAYQWHIKNAYLDGYREANRPLLEAAIKAQYGVTQQLLKERGFAPGSSLKIKRRMRFEGFTQGVNVHYSTASAVPEWAKVNVGAITKAELRPLNAFTTNTATAGFAGSYFIYADVPVEKVFSIPGGGFGCLHEYEVVIVGGNAHVRRFK